MATILAPGTKLIVIAYATAFEQTAENITHWTVDSTSGDPVSDFDVAKAAATVLGPLYIPMMGIDAKFWGASCRVFGLTPKPAMQISQAGAGPGTGPGGLMARQTCGLISWYSAYAGHQGRGRTYVPFPDVSFNLNSGIPTAAYIALLNALKTAYLGPFNVSNATVSGTAILKRVLVNKAWTNQVYVSAGIPRTAWATQKRRGTYGRPNLPPA